MITRIEALNYRCLRFVQQDLGPFAVLAGPNGSGKSTFLDVSGILRDIVQGGLEDAVARRVPDYSYLFWLRRGDRFELAIEAAVPEDLRDQNDHLRDQNDHLCDLAMEADREPQRPVCRYELAIGTLACGGGPAILAEALKVGHRAVATRCVRQAFPDPPSPPATIFTPPSTISTPPSEAWATIVAKDSDDSSRLHVETGDNLDRKAYVFSLHPTKSALANLPDDELQFPIGVWFKNELLGRTHTLVLNSEAMRVPSTRGWSTAPRRDGANLPWLVERLDPVTKQEWLRHVRTALPELRDVKTVLREEDAHRYVKLFYEGGAEVRSWTVSDGTLRLLELTLLDYLPDAGSVYLVEEPENGIHPGAVETVFQSLSSIRGSQVLVATHSPLLVGLAELSQLLCFAKPRGGPTDIVPGPEHPMLQDWHNDVDLGTFLAAGVLG